MTPRWALRWSGSATAELRWRQPLAGIEVVTDLPLAVLGPAQAVAAGPRPADASPPRGENPTFRGEVWVAGAPLELTAVWRGDEVFLWLGPEVLVRVDRHRREITTLSAPAPSAWLETVLLGPPVLVALAVEGWFGLHASAAKVGEQLVLFVGDSGAGKSTFVEGLTTPWSRWADDLVPVQEAPGQLLLAAGGFPQLKLPPDAAQCAPGDLGFPAAVVALTPADPAAEPAARPLSPLDAAALWLRHTMASKLFDRRLLEAHLTFATAAATAVPAYQLAVPRDLDRLPAARALVARLLAPG